LLPLSVAWGAVTAIDGDAASAEPDSGTPGADSSSPRCEIRVDRHGGGVVLEGLVFAEEPVSGSYRLRVWQKSGAGRSQISQSGDFSVESGSESLGLVSLANRGGGYVATLSVQWDGGGFDCTERVRGGKSALKRDLPDEDLPPK
jgi:hypothetical protein